MNKYLETIVDMMDRSLAFFILTCILVGIAVGGAIVITIITYGAPIPFAVAWWAYIVYKEANKDE